MRKSFVGVFCATMFAIVFLYGFPSFVNANETTEVWWPTQGATLDGTQPFKAVLRNKNIQEYMMFWQVDSGSYVKMYDSYNDYPHKEAMVDLTSWNWNNNGTYTINFIAQDLSGQEIAKTSVLIKHGVSSPAPVKIPTTTTLSKGSNVSSISGTITSATIISVAPQTLKTSLYVDPQNPALTQAVTWQSSRPQDALTMKKLGAEPSAIWLGGWNTDVKKDVATTIDKAKKDDAIVTFIAYNVPGRDCGSYSAGGVGSKDAYIKWIKEISKGLSDGKAILVLEPDALAGIDCLSPQAKEERFTMLSNAIDILKSNKNTKVYLDAGHSGWVGVDEMSARLTKAGISKAAGFSLNVSNFTPTDDNTRYGTELSKKIGGAHFIIDTSRNGSGSNGEWCNPSGRSLGQRPTLETKNPLIDAYLWLKKPGESDGNCNGGPNAGEWWPEYGLSLAKKAGY